MSELERKLALLEKLQAEVKAVRMAEKEREKATAIARKAALKEARAIVRKYRLEATDFA